MERGATGDVAVFVTVSGGARRVQALLDDDAAAKARGSAIVVGRIGTQAVPKLAGLKSVVSVGLVQLKQTGRRSATRIPLVGRRPSRAARTAALERLAAHEVPYDQAPKLKGSNFEQLKKLGVLDAKTHNFADAWNAGYAGEGVTVGVLDGGTDFGHPDLIGTWQTWSGATDTATVDDGWNGWPKAFDPYGTLVCWRLPATSTRACPGTRRRRRRRAPVADRDSATWSSPRAPGRRATPACRAAREAHLLVPAPLDEVRHRPARQPPRRLPARDVRGAPGVPRRRRQGAGVYDTVYVDLDNDHSFGDEKPVTKGSPASYRDMDGDGYTDLSGGLLYYISDGDDPIPGGADVFFGADDDAARRASCSPGPATTTRASRATAR